ncbi:replication factor C large subunit [Infirmifilum sp. NZ]|uniref:replication factor C large subunit n=1 Tax=Infirmifilum sp. NZ TaxID=2926850 RepID=UPI0027A67D67|nr:replication factor C large subunit [Infirmifilum sp. NZ]UNQ74223.1 replication factor C large subunit [Infirmifilum sp. NZ]
MSSAVKFVPWVEKYRPKRIQDVVGNEEAKKEYIAWLNSWIRGKPTHKAALLYGPPGCGKTSIVYATASEYKWELIEINASDVRSREAIQSRVFPAIGSGSLYGYSGKIVLIDEVDGVWTREDVGGLDAILDLINKTRYPVVLTANDPWDPKLKDLREACKLIEFKKIGKREIIRVLEEICSREGIQCDREVLSAIADNAKGDLRAAINDLQTIAMGRRSVSLADLQILGERAEQENMFEIVRTVLTAKTPEQALSVTRLPSLDYEMLIQWLSENIIAQYTPSYTAIADAYDALSLADIYLARMKREQMWALLPYVLELMTAGVASSRERPPFKFVKYSFPEKLRILSRYKTKREKFTEVARAAAKKLHVSTATFATEFLPYLRVINSYNKELAQRILRSIGVSEDAVRYVLEA